MLARRLAWAGAELGSGVCLFAAPRVDARVVAGHQYFWHRDPAVGAGSGVVGVVEGLAVLEGVLLGGARVPERAWQEPGDGVHDAERGQLTAGEDKVADGKVLEAQQVECALVEAFVAPAQEQGALLGCQLSGVGLAERAASGAKGDAAMGTVLGLDPFDAFDDGFRLEHHARTASKGAIVHGAVAVPCPVAKVHEVDLK